MVIMSNIVIFSLAIFLLVGQVIIAVVLLVLVRQYRRLRTAFEEYKAKNNLQSVRRSTSEKEKSKNPYIEGKRSPSTLVRSNSNESVVWVPTPSPQRKDPQQQSSTELNIPLQRSHFGVPDRRELTIDMNDAEDEQQQDNAGYDDEDGIYGNQYAIDVQASEINRPVTEGNVDGGRMSLDTHDTRLRPDEAEWNGDCEPVYANFDPRLLQAGYRC